VKKQPDMVTLDCDYQDPLSDDPESPHEPESEDPESHDPLSEPPESQLPLSDHDDPESDPESQPPRSQLPLEPEPLSEPQEEPEPPPEVNGPTERLPQPPQLPQMDRIRNSVPSANQILARPNLIVSTSLCSP